MEVKSGFKKSDVGDIPEEWEVRTIRNVSDMVTVGFVGSMAHLFTTNGVPLLRGQNVLPGRIDLTDSKFISLQTHTLWKKSALRGGDIVIVRVGYPGTSAVVPSDFGDANAASLVVVRPDSSCVESNFMCWVLLSDIGRRQVKAALVGGAQQVINIGTAASLLLPLPAKPEQSAIAKALSDVDGLLGGLERLIAKKRDLKLAAMQQLLTGQTRLPGFHGEWEVKRLGDLFEITSSKRVFQSEWKSEGIPFYRARELAVLGETGRVENELFITKSLYDSFRRAHGVPEVGDILVTGVGTLGKVHVVRNEEEFYFKDGNIIWFKIRGAVSAEFLRQLYLTKVVMKQITDGSAGTTVGTYTISGAKKTEIPFPLLPEQTAIAEVLTEMDAELAALEQRREKTRALKQAMMQELLTGRTRLL